MTSSGRRCHRLGVVAGASGVRVVQNTRGKTPSRPPQCALQLWPVEAPSGIVLAPRRHVFVTGDMLDRVLLCDGCGDACKRFVLLHLEAFPFEAFKLDAHGKIIAVIATLKAGLPCMPCALVTTHELPEFTGSLDIEMGRHLESPEPLEPGVLAHVQPVGEETLHLVATVLSRRQTDRMNHQKVDTCADGAWSEIG